MGEATRKTRTLTSWADKGNINQINKPH